MIESRIGEEEFFCFWKRQTLLVFGNDRGNVGGRTIRSNTFNEGGGGKGVEEVTLNAREIGKDVLFIG